MSKSQQHRESKRYYYFLFAIPFVCLLAVWFSPLAFVPVPWPDDSAFYFVAKYFFQWPPQWVMIPQAPFEPSYRIYNFNTMPLFPILIGLGRLIGIDGIAGIKLWSLGPWALSGLLAGWVFAHRKPHYKIPAILMVCAFGWDPILRWGSVIVRPEALIACLGMILVLFLTESLPHNSWISHVTRRRGFYDPIALLLALAAYAHFNAIHLLLPVIITILLREPRPIRELYAIGSRTALYLTPWLLTVVLRPRLFWQQMSTQFNRLAVPNDWLKSIDSAIRGLFHDMGSPVHWHAPSVYFASTILWIAILSSLALLIYIVIIRLRQQLKPLSPLTAPFLRALAPASAWVISSVWLWHSKPEVWFTVYIHWAILTLGIVFFVHLPPSFRRLRIGVTAFGAMLCALFFVINAVQWRALATQHSWQWSTYYQWIDCIDRQLIQKAQAMEPSRTGPFQVWAPTFPDILVELSRRHPEWEFTRTNDFHDRQPLALAHGESVDVMVVTETISNTEREIDAPAAQHPEVQSLWMNWRGYYLHQFTLKKEWKPNRYLCQKGRWQAFIYY